MTHPPRSPLGTTRRRSASSRVAAARLGSTGSVNSRSGCRPSQRGAPADPDAGAAYQGGANRLRADLNAVRDAVCRLGVWGAPVRSAERLADEAVTAFTRWWVTDDDIRQAALPWNYYVAGAITPYARRPGGRFDMVSVLPDRSCPARRTPPPNPPG